MLNPFLINKKNFKFFFSGRRNKIKTKVSKIDNNLDKLISIEYSLDNFHRSNQDTCLVHKPSVFEGQWVQSGDLLADCSASVGGELALGQNILIAYMPWEGYNFEDAILVSERLVYDDLYTSVHIERYELELRQTKQGMEEITREIPEVSEASLKHLNNFGIAKLGSWIKEGDILVGKVTPVNKKIQSNYQKLLYTILEKTVLPFRDTSLRAPKGIKAKVIGVQIFKHSKNNLVSDFRLKKLEDFNFENKKKSNLKKKIDSDYNSTGMVASHDSATLIREAKINKFLKLYSSTKLNTNQPIQKAEKRLDFQRVKQSVSINYPDEQRFSYRKVKKTETQESLSSLNLRSKVASIITKNRYRKSLNKNFSKTRDLTGKKIKNLFINKNDFFLNHKKFNKNVNSDLLTIKKLFNLINFYDIFSSANSPIIYKNHFFSWEFKKISFDILITFFCKSLVFNKQGYRNKKTFFKSFNFSKFIKSKKFVNINKSLINKLNPTCILPAASWSGPNVQGENLQLDGSEAGLLSLKGIGACRQYPDIQKFKFKDGDWFFEEQLTQIMSILPSPTNLKIKSLPRYLNLWGRSVYQLDRQSSWIPAKKDIKHRYPDYKLSLPTMQKVSQIQGDALNNSISVLNPTLYGSGSLEASSHQRLNDVSSIQIYLAEKRRLQVGDKMAGRHGNKGIISQILPIEDMPFLPDGKPLDMVLNPLGVPSRMNVGQIYECLLGLAGKYLGQHFKIFPFDEMYGAEASRSFVFSKLYDARLKTGKEWLFNQKAPGKIRLYDGRTGETFDQSITVGYAYMLRLVHMVDDKIHARSTGPYSLVTQQPLRGRSKQGGQRLGEMEVWALEGYGAAFTLLEMLTIKSDDMNGRMTLWSNLILNKEISIGTPESFKVLICELQALCLDIGLFKLL